VAPHQGPSPHQGGKARCLPVACDTGAMICGTPDPSPEQRTRVMAASAAVGVGVVREPLA
jgi:hypothetical protein